METFGLISEVGLPFSSSFQAMVVSMVLYYLVIQLLVEKREDKEITRTLLSRIHGQINAKKLFIYKLIRVNVPNAEVVMVLWA